MSRRARLDSAHRGLRSRTALRRGRARTAVWQRSEAGRRSASGHAVIARAHRHDSAENHCSMDAAPQPPRQAPQVIAVRGSSRRQRERARERTASPRRRAAESTQAARLRQRVRGFHVKHAGPRSRIRDGLNRSPEPTVVRAPPISRCAGSGVDGRQRRQGARHRVRRSSLIDSEVRRTPGSMFHVKHLEIASATLARDPTRVVSRETSWRLRKSSCCRHLLSEVGPRRPRIALQHELLDYLDAVIEANHVAQPHENHGSASRRYGCTWSTRCLRCPRSTRRRRGRCSISARGAVSRECRSASSARGRAFCSTQSARRPER